MRHMIYDLEGMLANTREGIITGIYHAIESQNSEICMQNIFRKYYDREGWKLTSLYGGVPAVLKHFNDNHIFQYIVTNKPKHRTTQIIESKQLTRYFKDKSALKITP